MQTALRVSLFLLALAFSWVKMEEASAATGNATVTKVQRDSIPVTESEVDDLLEFKGSSNSSSVGSTGPSLNRNQVSLSSDNAESREPPPGSRNITLRDIASGSNDTQKFSDFRPSPPLETYFEHNEFPVVPAFPEAKQLGGTPRNHNPVHWPQAEEEQSWKVKFPAPTIPTVKERPYQFYDERKPHGNPTSFGNGQGYASVSRVPVSTSIGVWDKYEENERKRAPPIAHKTHSVDFGPTANYNKATHFDFASEVRPTSHAGQGYHESYPPGGGGYGGGFQGIDPWKKIIKFLTAIIPIGLLISALTPSVITVTPMNETHRLRSEDDANIHTNHLISSLNYFNKLNSEGCEDRILCELLLSASASKDAENHVNNLLDNIAENGKAVERADDIKRIFEAVRRQDCGTIVCEDIKEKT